MAIEAGYGRSAWGLISSRRTMPNALIDVVAWNADARRRVHSPQLDAPRERQASHKPSCATRTQRCERIGG